MFNEHRATHYMAQFVFMRTASSIAGPGRASGNEGPEQPQPGPGRAGARVRSMLLCGADVVASFGVPGVWQEEGLRRILRDHGVVCIARWPRCP